MKYRDSLQSHPDRVTSGVLIRLYQATSNEGHTLLNPSGGDGRGPAVGVAAGAEVAVERDLLAVGLQRPVRLADQAEGRGEHQPDPDDREQGRQRPQAVVEDRIDR